MVAERLEPVGLGPLAASLAKAQAAFPAIPRDRKVTVKTRSGDQYTFKYAPLDTILSAVRAPLSANGLAISQMLEGDALVTVLLHESGAHLQGTVPLPHNNGDTVQQLGSAITYLRRYALQAILGIASEEDDDGNAASGNRATAHSADRDTVSGDTDAGGLIGIAQVGTGKADFELRQAPDGWVLAFKLAEGRKGIKAVAKGAMAQWLSDHRAAIEGQRVTAHGSIAWESFDKTTDGKKETIRYRVLTLARIETPAGAFPQPAVGAPGAPEQDDADLSGLDAPGMPWGGPVDEPR